jgi:hypothetical protein
MHDLRGNPVSTSSAVAMAAAERALWRMMSFYDVPLADLDEAAAADPGWCLPPLMKAGFLLSLTEPALVPEARALIDAAEARPAAPSMREQGHVQALKALCEGRWEAAVSAWDQVLIEHPRDALALQWAHLWDFYRGDRIGLRARPARCLSAWDEADPLWPAVMALHAFGLEENHLHAQAEEAARQALARDPRVPWAIHAAAHVMDMQGRHDDGAAWLRAHQAHWTEGNGFAIHLWWHAALFRLEGLDLGGALRLLDHHLAPEQLLITLNRVDAAALLWRLHLLGTDVHSRCEALAAAWPRDALQAGHSAFNDVHALLPLLASEQWAEAEAWIGRCAAQALAAEATRHANHALARDLGLPLMRGLLAQAQGEHRAAADALYAARDRAQRLGGSHAQRDLIELSLLAACVPTARDAGHRRLGQALVRERLAAKPATPLTRHWQVLLSGT